MNGHPIITYIYKVYEGHTDGSVLHPDHSSYLGEICFEAPGKMFTYTPHGQRPLTSAEVEQVIEFVSGIRDNPNTW